MRDDSKRWADLQGRSAGIEAPGLIVKPLELARLTLVSSPKVLTQTKLPLVEWPDVVTDAAYALSLRRDRVLEVNGPARRDGWDDKAGLAISDITDGYVQVELAGENALALLRRGTEIDLATPSRSVARLLFGMGVFVYRYGDETTYRLHAASAHGEALWHALEDAAKHLT